MNRFFHVLFWSIISAAFIGPGTVTTAAASGAKFGYVLLWALLFSTIACYVLQEASARITVMSGKTLGQALRSRFRKGAAGWLLLLLILGAIVLGCAAYQAGNILGSAAGAVMLVDVSPKIITLIIGAIAGTLLFWGKTKTIARILGGVVAFMGIAFLITAMMLADNISQILSGMFIPSFPPGSSLLIIGLVGTTIVPYNLFLGSGLAAGQNLKEIRFGLCIAIFLGGIISMGIMIVGTAITADGFGFDALAEALSAKLGPWAGVLFAAGLCAAGLSSAITAPLAAAITARSLFATDGNQWEENSRKYRSIWLGVLIAGVAFGVADVRPIPIIILAQALNGILLPFVAVFLFLIVNDRQLMGKSGLNAPVANVLMGAVVMVTIVLGVNGLIRAAAAAFNFPYPGGTVILLIAGLVIFVFIVLIFRKNLKGLKSL